MTPPPDPNPPVLPSPSPEPEPNPPAPAPRVRRANVDRVVCEFCECELSTGDGSYFAMSEKAKKYRKQEEKIETLESKLSAADETIADLRKKLADASTVRESKKMFDW